METPTKIQGDDGTSSEPVTGKREGAVAASPFPAGEAKTTPEPRQEMCPPFACVKGEGLSEPE